MVKTTKAPPFVLHPRLLPRQVRDFRTFRNGNTYALCPRCRLTMDREYVDYCSNCGQKLDWTHYTVGD